MSPRIRLTEQLSDIRSLLYLMKGNVYEEAYAAADAVQKAKVEGWFLLIQNPDPEIRKRGKDALKDWLRNSDETPMSKLMEECKNLGIPNYSRMTKIQMIYALQAANKYKMSSIK